MSDVFDEVQQQNSQGCGYLEVDIGYQSNGGVLSKGICITVEDQESPIFLSAEQLRRLADEADAS